jgi:hypothetical protein
MRTRHNVTLYVHCLSFFISWLHYTPAPSHIYQPLQSASRYNITFNIHMNGMSRRLEDVITEHTGWRSVTAHERCGGSQSMELISVASVRTKERRYKYCRFDGNAYSNLVNNPTCETSSSGIYMIKLFIQKYPTRCNSVSKFISYSYEAQHDVSGDTPPIIRSLKLH